MVYQKKGIVIYTKLLTLPKQIFNTYLIVCRLLKPYLFSKNHDFHPIFRYFLFKSPKSPPISHSSHSFFTSNSPSTSPNVPSRFTNQNFNAFCLYLYKFKKQRNFYEFCNLLLLALSILLEVSHVTDCYFLISCFCLFPLQKAFCHF